MSLLPTERPLDLELPDIETHTGTFSRGYHVGYVRAMLHFGDGAYAHRLPEERLQDVQELLEASGMDYALWVYQTEPPNQYQVRFCRIMVVIHGTL